MKIAHGTGAKYILAALTAVFLIACGSTAFAYRCGNRLVKVGDTKSEVLQSCGSPSWWESWDEERVERHSVYPFPYSNQFMISRVPILTVVHVTIEEWTYNRGPTQFIRILTFENSRLVRIETGDYGYN